jgi:ferredoxin
MIKKFEAFLDTFDEAAWLETLSEMLPEMHKVERNAVQIWFRFYPLSLHRYLKGAEDRQKAIQKFVLQGNYELANQIDSSHRFLYGHRFWKEAKTVVLKHAESFVVENADLKTEARAIAREVAQAAKTTECTGVGISLVALMTLVQVGADAFSATDGTVNLDSRIAAKSAKQVLEERARDDSQGLFGFLKTVDKKFSVTYDEAEPKAKFRIINDEQIATAAARDQSRNWLENDSRCIEGVIPVECRSAACGTCWVGVLGGQEKLSEVAPLERKQMKIFGYNQPDDEKPFLRLSCQAKAHGNASIVIPPWNGVFGKKVYGNVEEIELLPATTSAAKLRETIAAAVEK